MLLEHPGQVVTREALQKRLWPANTFVDFEQSLNAAVKRLRAALGDSADSPLFIETLPRRGYRFIAPVTQPAKNVAPPEISYREPALEKLARRNRIFRNPPRGNRATGVDSSC